MHFIKPRASSIGELPELVPGSGGHEDRAALVPLKSHANQHSFFGSEGLTSKDFQGFEGLSWIPEPEGAHEHLMHNHSNRIFPFQQAVEGASIGKENISINIRSMGSMEDMFDLHQDIALFHEGPSYSPSRIHERFIEDEIRPSTPITAISQATNSPTTARLLDEEIHKQVCVPRSDLTSQYSQSSSPTSSSSSSVYSEEFFRPRRRTGRRLSMPSRRPLKRRFVNYHPKQETSSLYLEDPDPKEAKSEPEDEELEPEAYKNKGRFEGDLYTPKFIRGVGDSKQGFCSHCNPGIWLRMKQSSYWYHLNYHHGISASTGQPYDSPAAWKREMVTDELFRVSAVCGTCEECIIVSSKYLSEEEKGVLEESSVDMSSLNLMAWYKHAQKCQKSKPKQMLDE